MIRAADMVVPNLVSKGKGDMKNEHELDACVRSQRNLGHRYFPDILSIAIAVAMISLITHARGYSMSPQNTTQIDPSSLDTSDAYFEMMGPKLKVHFTIYRLYGSDALSSPKRSFDPSVSTIHELIREIETKLPGIRVILDEEDKKHPVIHVIEEAAEKQSKIFDRLVDLNYSGPVGFIARELHRRDITQIAWPLSGDNTQMYNDTITDVKINVKHRSVRDVLTHCVDKDRYYWIIWDATTLQEFGEWTTQIRFSRSMDVGSEHD
ncbi:hypothetical protein [Allorhodopirellula heiligendammensis]|uniref:hypothetical protein n=1 Tax=Allorhodopirellula heiligendammensis TaxID=2714739 RepID=UPI0011B70B6E|nr:hypothetical protein [Allorhodopirellula heiligendammensis]